MSEEVKLATAYIHLVIAKHENRLFSEEIDDLNRALAVLGRLP